MPAMFAHILKLSVWLFSNINRVTDSKLQPQIIKMPVEVEIFHPLSLVLSTGAWIMQVGEQGNTESNFLLSWSWLTL